MGFSGIKDPIEAIGLENLLVDLGATSKSFFQMIIAYYLPIFVLL